MQTCFRIIRERCKDLCSIRKVKAPFHHAKLRKLPPKNECTALIDAIQRDSEDNLCTYDCGESITKQLQCTFFFSTMYHCTTSVPLEQIHLFEQKHIDSQIHLFHAKSCMPSPVIMSRSCRFGQLQLQHSVCFWLCFISVPPKSGTFSVC